MCVAGAVYVIITLVAFAGSTTLQIIFSFAASAAFLYKNALAANTGSGAPTKATSPSKNHSPVSVSSRNVL